MPGMFNGKATEYTEYIFKMEACMSTLYPAGKGGEILRAAATEVKDMDDAEVANLAAIYWKVSALDSALASSLITTTIGEVGTLVRRVLQAFPGSGLRAWQELNRWYRPKSAVEGAASGRHHRAVKSEVDRRFAAIHHGLGTPCGRARGETQ